ncbi:MAG: MBL fold metallo-hydrolase [Pseudomonadota bacterium]
MKLHVLGGGDEVGASLLFVETDAGNFVVDCGIRMGGRAASSPPDLAPLDEHRVDAIFVTHAHLDHTGALPLLHSAMPTVPIFCTPPTRALMRVLLLDAVKIMDEKLDREGELPLYPVEAVESLLARLKTVPLGGAVRVGAGERLTMRFLPAGHILGAAMLQATGPKTSLLVTGDISQAGQYTVPGLTVPAEGSRVVVAESTYGGRMHSDRSSEERRFVTKVREVLGRGGKLLVPAFALGRAQELLLLLIRAMRKGELEPVPVYADGMVKRICGVYADFPNDLPPFARKLAAQHGDPFFGPLENVQRVADGAARERILDGPPCVIVASSGMLTGGASVLYAQRLVGHELNCIAITGYQDEEAPGRRLLELANGAADSITINRQAVAVRCEVAKYGLSAHIDGYSLLQLVAGMAPDHALWVHGDSGARGWLHERCSAGTSHLVANGQTLTLDVGGAPIRHRPHALGMEVPLDAAKLCLLADALRGEGQQGRVSSPSQLLDRWYGESRWGGEEEQGLREVLADSTHFEVVERDGRTGYLLRGAEESLALAAQALGPALPNVVAEETARLFPADTGLHKARQYQSERRVALSFNFPKRAELDYRDRIAALAERTGWTVEVYPQPNMGVLLDEARVALVPLGTLLKVGFMADRGAASARLTAAPDPDRWAELAGAFEERTGYELIWQVRGPGNVVRDPAPSSPEMDGRWGPMEINAAYRRLEAALTDAGVGFFKKGKKSGPDGEFIEVRFVTPAVGEGLAGLLEDLSREICWPIAISPNITVNELQRVATDCAPAGFGTVGVPRVHADLKEVRVILQGAPSADEVEEARREFRRQTGFELLLVTGS